MGVLQNLPQSVLRGLKAPKFIKILLNLWKMFLKILFNIEILFAPLVALIKYLSPTPWGMLSVGQGHKVRLNQNIWCVTFLNITLSFFPVFVTSWPSLNSVNQSNKVNAQVWVVLGKFFRFIVPSLFTLKWI